MCKIPIRFISGAAIAALVICVAMVGAQAKKEPAKTQGTQATAAKEASHAVGMTVWTSDRAEWADCSPLLPPGCKIKVANGDLSKGPSDFYEKVPAGYAFPLHYHTALQTFWIQSGALEFHIWKSGEKKVLPAGSFVLEPSKAIHRGKCIDKEGCYFFGHSGGPLDIMLVDEKGKEIPPKTK